MTWGTVEDNEASIPVIDINAPDAAKALLEAACEHGFIFVKHHDLCLSPGDVQSMFKLSKDFFALPASTKESATINTAASGKNVGFVPMHKESLDPKKQKKGDFKEGFNVGEFRNGRPVQPLPGPLRFWRVTMAAS